MKITYIKSHKGGEPCEITKKEARCLLEGYWKTEALDDIFDNDKMFRLFTPFSDIETMSDDGLTPTPGFYGVCD